MIVTKTLVFFTWVASFFSPDSQSPFLDEKHKHGFVEMYEETDIFYWLFESRSKPSTDPLVLWLTGGPGCSSEIALFYENGPFIINDDLTLSKNQHSWNERANLMFIDHPYGTGFSSSASDKYVKNIDEVANEFLKFFTKWLDLFPQYKGRKFFITGESYAGHYIPAIAEFILRKENRTPDINLKGIAIGNGAIAMTQQYAGYLKFSSENNLADESDYSLGRNLIIACLSLINQKRFEDASDFCNSGVNKLKGKQNLNFYDIRKKCEGDLCYNFENLERFLKSDQVVEILGTKDRKWKTCNNTVSFNLENDLLTDMRPQVIKILERQPNLKVLFYYGDKDYICNWNGGLSVLDSLEWSHKTQFNEAKWKKWVVNGKEAGEFKEAKNLVFLKVFDSGHMVPMDTPEAALLMLDKLLGH